MTVSAPPRPASPARPAPDGRPLDREEVEALVEALIEEARRETRRRHRTYWALAALVTFVGVVVLILLEGGAASQTASPALSARFSASAQTVTSRLAFTSFPHDHPKVPSAGNPLPPGIAELYVVNADGSGKSVLTRMQVKGQPVRVAWSPDGQTIAFAGFTGQGTLLFVNADGSGQRDVTRELKLGGLPIWSPDGQKIALAKGCCGQKTDIYVMNADGSGLRRLTRNRESWGPIWSPNGNKIAFVRVRVSPRPGRKPPHVWTPEVWIMNADGSGQRRLSRGVPSAWSPDGQKIAFTGLPDHQPGLYIMNADGTGQRRLTRSAGYAWGVAWSPDGQEILFVGYRPGTRGKVSNIYVMNADGSGERRLTERGHNPRWSADGQKISFVSNRDGNLEVYVMNADGSAQVNVSQNPLGDEAWHDWSPK